MSVSSALAAVVGVVGSALGVQRSKPNEILAMPKTTDIGPDQAKQNLEQQEQLRQRRGRASTLLQPESGPVGVATTQTGGKTTLGG